jgi:[ribosomal protein S18]-alanine N-acetyltransferase
MSNPVTSLSEMLPKHIAQVRLIEQLTGMTPWSEADFKGALADPQRWTGWVVIAEEQQVSVNPAAFALMTLIAPEAELSKLAVHPDYQRMGLASTLLDRVLRHAQARGCQRCYLEVRSRNSIAIAFYIKHGFAVCGMRKGYYRDPQDDALLMVRPIPLQQTDPNEAFAVE